MSDIETIEGMMTEARHFHNVVESRPTSYQVTQEQADMLDSLATAAETLLVARTADEESLISSRAAFKAAFEALEKFFRALRQSVKDNPATTDVDRAELHLTTGGDADDEMTNPLEFAPLVYVENAGIHNHLTRFFMQGEESDSTKRPKRTKGCNIYLKIGGEATTNIKADYDLITMDTKSPYNYPHDAADAGKIAHYVCCWVDYDDNLSPQSEAFSIVIT